MVLKDDTINQTMLIPMDLRNLIPGDHPCYFIKNVVDQIDCSEANKEFRDKPGEPAYPREMLLRLVLMSVFDGGLSSREIERRIRTDIAYMYLAGMQKPVYRTILRFKLDYPDLIDEAFKTTLKIAKEEDLIKIHHLSLDGTKIKAKTSMKNITNEQQLKIMKEHLEESIKLDQEEDSELGEESGNSVPESLTNKEKFQKTVEKINNSSENDIDQDKLRASSKNLLKQAEENPEKIYKKIETIEEKLNESEKDVISINDSDSRLMVNKKGKWEYDYNGQIAVDSHKGIIVASYITNNPTDHYELVPLMEQVQSNLAGIYDEMPVNYQVSADNGYSTDENTEYLDKHGLDGYIASRKLSRKEKNRNLSEKPFSKDNFNYNYEMMTYICPLGQPLYKKANNNTKTKQESRTGQKNAKTAQYKNIAAKHNDTESSATMETFPKSKCNEKWKQKKHKKSTKYAQKQQNYHFQT